MNKNQLISFALLADKQGYAAAAKSIKEQWSSNSDWDKDWALRIAYLADKRGYSIAQQAVNNPHDFDNRTEEEKIADTISGNNAHLNPELKELKPNKEQLYRGGGLEEVSGTNGLVWQIPKPNKEDCSGIAALIDQGTQDIMERPGIDQEEAMRDANFLRELKEKRKKL